MKKKYIDIIIFTIVAILFCLYERNDMYCNALGLITNVETPFQTIIVFSLCLFLFVYIVFNLHFWRCRSQLLNAFVIFSAISIVLSCIISLFIPFGSRSMYGIILLPIFLFLFFCFYGNRNDSERYNSFIFFLLLCGLFASYVESYSLKLFLINKEETVSNTSYYVLYFLPLVLCNKNKIVRIIAIILVTIAVISSAKRGGLIALFISLVVYLYVYYSKINKSINSNQNKIVRKFLIVAILGVSSYFLVNFLANSELLIVSRLLDISESQGSGRVDVWKVSFRLIADSSFCGLLFGHGWDGVAMYSPLGLSAHNDFIEVFYDYGVIAFFFYIWFYLSLIKFGRRLIKEQSRFAAPFIASYCMLFCNSMVSHIIIYPSYLMIFTIFWGYVIGFYYKQRRY